MSIRFFDPAPIKTTHPEHHKLLDITTERLESYFETEKTTDTEIINLYLECITQLSNPACTPKHASTLNGTQAHFKQDSTDNTYLTGLNQQVRQQVIGALARFITLNELPNVLNLPLKAEPAASMKLT